jgi:sialic acid synthase SpsE
MINKVLIIAEAGVNHNGSLENAKKLILAGAEAGVDYVKFQTFKANKLVSKDAKKADYQKINTKDENTSQFEMLKKLEMPESWHHELIKYAKSLNVKFLSTGFDEESIFASAFALFNIEYRKIIARNSYLCLFSDMAASKLKYQDISKSNSFVSVGTGLQYETGSGIFNLLFAVGKRNDVTINFRQAAKIHLGYVNYF